MPVENPASEIRERQISSFFFYLRNAFGLRFLLSNFNATMILSKLLDEQRPFQNDSKDSQKFGGDSE